MNHKLKTFLIAGFAILLFVGVTVIFLYTPVREKFAKKQTTTTQEPDGKLPELICNYQNDQEAYADAITTQNVNQCSCIKDEKFQDVCKKAIMDLSFYTGAIERLDQSLCDKILNVSQKEACISIVKDGITHFGKEDPQYLANVYAGTHNENAIAVLEQLVQEDQTNIENLITLALSYAEKGLREQEQGKDQTLYVEKAFSAIEKAKSIDSGEAEVYRVEAYINEIKPDYNAALLLYNRTIDIDPSNILAFAGRGHVHNMMGSMDDALSDFHKAAELDKANEYEIIYANLCRLGMNAPGDMEEMIKNCKLAIRPSNNIFVRSESLQILAMLYLPIGEYELANDSLLTAKTLTPNDPNVYVTLARLNIYQKNFIESEKNARKAIELSQARSAGYLALSQALYMQEKYDESIQVAQKGLMLIENDVSLLSPNKLIMKGDLYYSIAHSYRQLGNTAKQIEYEKKAQESSN